MIFLRALMGDLYGETSKFFKNTICTSLSDHTKAPRLQFYRFALQEEKSLKLRLVPDLHVRQCATARGKGSATPRGLVFTPSAESDPGHGRHLRRRRPLNIFITLALGVFTRLALVPIRPTLRRAIAWRVSAAVGLQSPEVSPPPQPAPSQGSGRFR